MARTKRPTTAELKKMKLVNLIRDVQSSGSGPEDSWNPAEISERLKDINFIRKLVDSWNPSELNHALQLLGFKTIDSWNPAIIEEMRTSLIRIFQERIITGNPIELNLPGNLPYEIKSMTLTMNPIQDLHGYDHPWAGGNGKNKFQNTASTTTLNGVTFTINSDGTVRATGTATENTYMTIGRFYAESGVTYILNGCPSGGANNKYRMTLVGYGYEYGDGYSFTGDGSYHQVSCDVYSNAGAVDLLFTPMMRLSTVTDATFAPYSNICPISGRDSVDVVISDGETEQTKTITFPSTIYGGTDEVVGGMGTSTYGYIASYNGETLPGYWISDRDVYAEGTTPTTGAEVCYELATPTPFSTTPVTDLELNKGTNIISSDADDIELKYQINLS